MTLSAKQLNDVDRNVLTLLHEGRITPGLAQTLLAQRGIADVSRQYVNQRLGRLAEHNHVRNIEGSGVYEVVSDPRAASDVQAAVAPVFKRLSRELEAPIVVDETIYEDGDQHPLSDADTREEGSTDE